MPIAMSIRAAQNASPVWPNFNDLAAADRGAVTLSDYLVRLRDHGSRLRFTRNELIFNQDDPVEHFYRVLEGTVRLCRYMPDGRRYIVDFPVSGDIIGLTENPDQPVTAEAVTDVLLIAYPRACFDRIAASCPELRTQHLCHLSASLMTAQQHMFVLGCQRAKERVASFLLRLADRLDVMEGDRLTLAMSRQDIADHLGLTIETVSRSVSALRGDGAILAPNSNQLILRDTAMLRSLAAEN